MGLLGRKVTTAQIGSSAVKAAAGVSSVGNFASYTSGTLERRAVSIPSISRARDLMASQIGSLELKHYQYQWINEDYEEIYLPREPWMDRPDPNNTIDVDTVRIDSERHLLTVACQDRKLVSHDQELRRRLPADRLFDGQPERG